MASMLALAMASPLALGGCSSTLQDLGNAVTGPATPAQATTVGAAEQAYTVALNLGTVWLKSGKATKAQAATAKAMENALYTDLVAARTAVANGDNPGVAAALSMFNQAMPQLTAYIATNGGGS
jgi:hypothetical protein